MRSELDIAGDWHLSWWLTVANMPTKKALRWEKRVRWAVHRFERARRAVHQEEPRCWYCERSGHDETAQPCPDRVMDARRWQAFGKMWSGKEGA